MKEDSVEINNYVRDVRITRRVAERFGKNLPRGRLSPIAGHVLIRKIKDKGIFKRIFHGVQDDVTYIGELAKIALVNYSIPIGSCKKGRFFIVNEEDRDYAIHFLEVNKWAKGSYEDGGRRKNSKVWTFRYRALHDLEINGKKRPLPEEKYKDNEEIEIEKREGKEMEEKTNVVTEEEISVATKPLHELSENSCVSFNDEMDLIVISPYDAANKTKSDPKMIDAYEMSIDTISNHKDVVEAVLHLGTKTWINKDMLLDFIKMSLNKI